MRTTKLGAEIVKEAIRLLEVWRDNPCHEIGNVISCKTDTTRNFPYANNKQAWCASFATTVVNTACKNLGVKNLLTVTAGTLDAYNKAKGAGLSDADSGRKIAVGALAYRRYDACYDNKGKLIKNGTCGHLSVVVEVTKESIFTIEGNSGDLIQVVEYTHDKFWKQAEGKYAYTKGHFIIHTETMDGETGFTADNPFKIPSNASKGNSSDTNDDHQRNSGEEDKSDEKLASNKKRNYFIRK